MIWALIGGFAGAKLLYYITILDQIIAVPSLLLDISNGSVVYGGIIGGVLAGYIYCRHAKISFIIYSDLLLPSVALAQGFACYITLSNHIRMRTQAIHEGKLMIVY